ncbi:bifunctional diguanylate cyclase/phosphodiesterase [Cohaesibacter celericrescens]|uniref:Bifunctional diguanylate cyclase/phosphodiesterase n=1 Tax=Cohaesibacter celericrescens TaxID=2067669 RepID=A0A2N5XK56_9HYPH|nr:EAL domain-containing protein [Cohaesibacter celericrescens]PLW74807.1 bifunctional diguanylate cyclase/phosphodiesterase [Cohaesibacter celericrescens]
MLNVLNCIYDEHNLYLVFLAGTLCLFGSAVTVHLLRRSVTTQGAQRFGWCFLASVAGGGSVWTTHFVSMLAYEPKVPVSFDPALTVLSLVIAMVGLFVSFVVSGLKDRPALAIVGGAFAGLTFSAMHHTGMFAYRVTGLVDWNFDYIWASISIPTIFSATAFFLVWQQDFGTKKLLASMALMVLGIVGLHFTGMAALTVTPMSQSFPEIDAQAVIALAMAIAVVALIILGTGLTSYLIDTNVRANSNKQLHHMVSHDALTGLPNRVSFEHQLSHALQTAQNTNKNVAVLGIDLNRFKVINDSMGHAIGDKILQALAGRMKQTLQAGEFVARVGGDEFAAIKFFHRKSEISAFAERLKNECIHPINIGSTKTTVAASFGAAIWPDDAADPDELAKNAGLATDHAKRAFMEQVCFYDSEIGTNMRDQRHLAEALKLALQNDDLELHYQVQKSLSQNLEILGFEALLRWQHPKLGPISPEIFIPVAEENGLIFSLGEWVLRSACVDAVTWDPHLKIAVNVSAVQLMDPNLPHLVHTVLVETGLSPNRLELELTETALMKDRMQSLHIMRQIRSLGVGIALDDFGTGYSSLEILHAFSFDKIKIDKSFVHDIEDDRKSLAIVRAVLALGKSLDIPVLAEGIETHNQVSILRAEGCDEGQGFLLGRPSSLKELIWQDNLKSNPPINESKLA